MKLDINENCEKIHKELTNEICSLFFQNSLFQYSEKVSELFLKLYRNSLKENYYWQYCPFKVFQSNFEIEFVNFKRDQIDEPDFVFYQKMIQQVFDNTSRTDRKIEYYGLLDDGMAKGLVFIEIMESTEEYYFTFFEDGLFFPTKILINDMLDYEIKENIRYSQQKKIDFVLSKIDGKDIPLEKETEIIEQPEIFLDYSDNSAAEKIVFLHELGILDFLMKKEPFNTSIFKLAEGLSSFTGINQTTAQSYLNPIFSSGVDQSKNPRTTKNIKTVTEKLIKMGFIRK